MKGLSVLRGVPAAAICLTAVALSGCLYGDDSIAFTEDGVAVVAEPLTWSENLDYWPSPSTVNLCFTGPNVDVTTQNFVRAAILGSWGTAGSGLSFNFQGVCPATIPSATVSIFLRTGNPVGAWGGVGQPGRGGRLTSSECVDVNRDGVCNKANPVPPDFDSAARYDKRADIQMFVERDTVIADENLADVIVHEMGHVLGFRHEQDRADNPHLCCIDASMDGHCDPLSWAAPDIGEAPPGKGETTGFLTKYDPTSIMSYCAAFYGEGDVRFSPMDALGAEIMHPLSYNSHRLGCGTGCFYTSAGVTLRTDGFLVSDWTARGAVGIRPDWFWAGGQASGLETLSATSLPTSTNVTYRYVDQRARLHQSPTAGPIQSQKSNPMHTAILGAVAMRTW